MIILVLKLTKVIVLVSQACHNHHHKLDACSGSWIDNTFLLVAFMDHFPAPLLVIFGITSINHLCSNLVSGSAPETKTTILPSTSKKEKRHRVVLIEVGAQVGNSGKRMGRNQPGFCCSKGKAGPPG